VQRQFPRNCCLLHHPTFPCHLTAMMYFSPQDRHMEEVAAIHGLYTLVGKTCHNAMGLPVHVFRFKHSDRAYEPSLVTAFCSLLWAENLSFCLCMKSKAFNALVFRGAPAQTPNSLSELTVFASRADKGCFFPVFSTSFVLKLLTLTSCVSNFRTQKKWWGLSRNGPCLHCSQNPWCNFGLLTLFLVFL